MSVEEGQTSRGGFITTSDGQRVWKDDFTRHASGPSNPADALVADLRQSNSRAFLREIQSQPVLVDRQRSEISNSEIANEAGTSASDNIIQERILKTKFPSTLEFNSFIKDRYNSFFYFQNHPSTSQLFEKSDVEIASQLMRAKSTSSMTTFFTFALSFHYVSRYIRYKNIPWALTYRFSFLSFFMRCYVFPSLLTDIVDKYFFKPPFEQSMDEILNKYQITENPIFKETFEAQKRL